MEAYAIYLTVVLITKEKIDVGPMAYFDTQEQCEIALTSDRYYVLLEHRFGGALIFKRDSICKKVETI